MTDDKAMPLMEHLGELRRRLIRCVLVLIVGMGVAWNFSRAPSWRRSTPTS
jgi:sec-independent protein translocase protein TatC